MKSLGRHCNLESRDSHSISNNTHVVDRRPPIQPEILVDSDMLAELLVVSSKMSAFVIGI